MSTPFDNFITDPLNQILGAILLSPFSDPHASGAAIALQTGTGTGITYPIMASCSRREAIGVGML